MRYRWLLAMAFGLMGALVAGCGGDAVIAPGGTSTGAGGSTSTGSGGTGTTTSTGSTTSSTTSGSGGAPALAMTVDEVTVFIDCMPMVGPDPVYVEFAADYDNAQGAAAAEATILEARLLLGSGGLMLTWTFDVMPIGSGSVPAGQTVTRSHEKVPASGSGDAPDSPCNYCAVGAATLQLDVEIDGVGVEIEEPTDSYICGL